MFNVVCVCVQKWARYFFFTIKYMINYNNLKKKKDDFNRANYIFTQPTLRTTVYTTIHL